MGRNYADAACAPSTLGAAVCILHIPLWTCQVRQQQNIWKTRPWIGPQASKKLIPGHRWTFLQNHSSTCTTFVRQCAFVIHGFTGSAQWNNNTIAPRLIVIYFLEHTCINILLNNFPSFCVSRSFNTIASKTCANWVKSPGQCFCCRRLAHSKHVVLVSKSETLCTPSFTNIACLYSVYLGVTPQMHTLTLHTKRRRRTA